MAYTFAQLKTAARHALGGDPDSDTSLGEIVNRAAAFLAHYHPWSWRTAFADVAFVEDSHEVALPEDCVEIVSVEKSAAAFTYVTPADEYEIVRRLSDTSTTRLYYLFAANKNTGAPVLRVAPKPTANLANALIVCYRRTLTGKAATGTDDDTETFPLPDWQNATLLQLCRAFAISTEEQQEGEDWRRALAMLESDRLRDAAGRGTLGTPRGTTSGQYGYVELKAEARRIMGTVPGTNEARVVNEAIYDLCSMHPWRWRVKTTTLELTQGQDYIDLPADFGEIVAIIGKESKYVGVRPADMESILLHRVHGPGGSLMYLLYHVGMADQAAGETAAPLRRLEIAPTPQATVVDALQITYRQLIPAFAEDGSADDGKAPDIPTAMQGAMLATVRYHAALAGNSPNLNVFEHEMNRLVDLAKKSDTRAGPAVLGPMYGTVENHFGDPREGWPLFTPPFGELP